MFTPLSKITLHDLWNQSILFDANIFMMGINERSSDANYSFDSMKRLYIIPLFESFTDIYIHNEVYKELDDEARAIVDTYRGKNVTIVDEENLYGKDPRYTTIFNNIASHELVQYKRSDSKNRGEVFSLAYAAHHNMNYFCSGDAMVDNVARELEDLKDVNILTFDIVLLNAYVCYARRNDNSNSKALKAIYKRYCADVIKRHGLPQTLGEYIRASQIYL